MDPYAATQPQTYQPTTTPSSQIQQDPYIYAQQTTYDPYSYYSQPTTYDQSQPTTYDQSQQYANASVYQQPPAEQQFSQQQTEQQQQQEHAPIHPPGVPVQPDPNQIAAYQQQGYAQTYYQTDPNSYYYPQPQVQPQPQPVSYPDPSMVHSQWQQPEQPQQPQQQHHGQPGGYGLTSMYPPNGQGGQQSGPSRGGGRGFRGGSSSSFRGRGRGGGSGGSGGRGSGGGRGVGGGRGSSGRGGGGRGVSIRGGGRGGRPSVSQPKPQFLAWCELCRVDCNTHEVLENHKNGKKHKKNLEIQEDLKRLAGKTQPEIEAMNAAAAAAAVAAAAAAASEQPPEVKDESQMVESEEPQGNSMKRKMMDEERKSAEPMKRPKEAVPFICELCDVKCESAPVFDCHLKGRKHMFNLQRFQEQQATLGQVALQALYPALEAALYPVLIQALAQSASTSYAYGGLDQQVLQLLQPFLPQAGPQMFTPGPGYLPHGPNPGVTLQEVGNQVEPVNVPKSKTEDQAEPESKTEDQVDLENKTEDQAEPESKIDDQMNPENGTDDQVNPKNGTDDQVEPENELESQVELEMKTEEVNPNAGESTQ